MKKIFLICIGILLLWSTLQVMLQMGGGVAAIYRKIEYTWWTFQSKVRHDPGQCARIGDDIGQGNPGHFRENCLYTYVSSQLTTKADCAADNLIVDPSQIIALDAREWFRQECLMTYYKHLFGTPLAKTTKACTGLSDQLIEFSYYRQNIRSKNTETLSVKKNPYISALDLFTDCEQSLK